MSTTFSANITTPKATQPLGLLESVGANKLLFERSKQKQSVVQPEPQVPRYLSEGTVLTDLELAKIAFEIIAKEEGGDIDTRVEGIEDEVNRRMVIALKTPKVKAGLGLVKWEKTAALYWNRDSKSNEVKRLRQKLEDTYTALLVNEILNGNGNDIVCRRSGKAIVLEAYGPDDEEMTFLIEEGKITGDLAGFQGGTCMEAVKRLRALLKEGGVELSDVKHEPKSDDAGEVEIDGGEKATN